MAVTSPLQRWLEKPGRTQAALAREAGVSQSFISRLARGERNINPIKAERVARAIKRISKADGSDDTVSVEALIFFWRRRQQLIGRSAA